MAIEGWTNTYGSNRSALIGDGELCLVLDTMNMISAQMIGLNDDPGASNGYEDMNYTMYFYLRPDQDIALIQIREDGTFKSNAYYGNADISDLSFCIRRTGTTIEYVMADSVIYTSDVPSSTDLYYDQSFYSAGGIWESGYARFIDINLCGDVQLNYAWSTGATTKSITVSESNTYTLSVTDAHGCETIVSATANVLADPVVTFTDSGTGSCDDPEVTITALPAGMNYLWEDGSTNQNLVVNGPGTYFVTVTNEFGCSGVGSKNVSFEDPPLAVVTGDTQLCVGETTTLSPSSGGTWTSSNTSVAIVSNDGVVASVGPGKVLL